MGGLRGMSTMGGGKGVVDVDAGTGACQELLSKLSGVFFFKWT